MAAPGYLRAYASTTVLIRSRGVLLPAAGANWRPLVPGTDDQYTGPLFSDPFGTVPLTFPASADERGTVEVWSPEPVRLDLAVWGNGYPSVRQVVDLLYTEDTEAMVALTAHIAAADAHPQYLFDTQFSIHEGAANPHPLYLLGTEFDAHLADPDPHPVYLTSASLVNHVLNPDPHPLYSTDADLTAHAAAANPHPIYLTQTEGDTIYAAIAAPAAAVTAHEADANPHPQYATDTDLAAHEAAANPHPGYLTQTEADAIYAPISGETVAAHLVAPDPHPQYLTPAEGDAAYAPVGAPAASVTAHESAADPHPTYLTQTEGDARYALTALNATVTALTARVAQLEGEMLAHIHAAGDWDYLAGASVPDGTP